MTSSQSLYNDFKSKMQKITDVRMATAVLGWDQETYLPEKGAGFRGQQITTLSSIAHELSTEKSLGDLLRELHQRQDLDAVAKRNVALALEDYEKHLKYPAPFVAALSQATNACYHAWIKARKANDYAIFAPELASMVSLKKQEADLLGYAGHPYNALLDEYEKGATVAMLDTIFGEVKNALTALLQQIAARPQVDKSILFKTYPKDKQWAFGLELLTAMGYDLKAGRQDLSEHPFTTSFSPEDVRITTRVDEHDFGNMTWSCIHEGGHALYEQGLPTSQYGLPCGEAASLGIHESQSRLWENNIGRSRIFWEHHYPALQALFPQNLQAVPLTDFYHAINQVQPSLVRTEADELTYHAHVMIRYEIEKALLDGSLDTKDLSAVWNQHYQQFLGVTVPDDRQGILQDIHWSHGSFGYFPTYSLGSFYAAQFMAAARQQVPGLDAGIKAGDYSALLQWLRKEIHAHGRFYTSNALCKRVTGEELQFRYFLQYAKEKYGEIYKF